MILMIICYSSIPYLITYLILRKRKLESSYIGIQALVFIVLGWTIFALLGIIGYTYICNFAVSEYVSDNARLLPLICIMCAYFFIFYYAIPMLAENIDIVLLWKKLKLKLVKYISRIRIE